MSSMATSAGEVRLREVGDGEPRCNSLSRDLEGARTAYESQDTEQSRAAHDADAAKLHGGAAAEHHGGVGGRYVKSLVFGGLDGIITTFAVVAAVAGGGLSSKVVLLMGFANLVADGISMGFGDFVSSQAENDYTRAERKREKWEMDNYPQGEKREMEELYVARGMTPQDAKDCIEIMARYPAFFVDVMMVEELGLMPPDDTDSPAMNGIVTFGAFVVFGLVPVLGFVIFGTFSDGGAQFALTCVATGLTMFALGALKGKFTNQSKLRSGSLMLLNGAMAATAAYLIGWGIAEAFGGDNMC